MSDLNNKKEMTKEEFAAYEIREFCKYVMHPESDLHKDADDWIKERLQANEAKTSDESERVCKCSIYHGDEDNKKCTLCKLPLYPLQT